MTHKHFDVIVAGLGAMGSATVAQLALRGRKVLGLDRWVPGHHFGSSHGDSRIIREMYFEHPMYVPLLQRAYDLWAVLGERVDETLLHLNGGLMIGQEGGKLVTGTLRSAREHGLDFEMLDAKTVSRRYPAFELGDDLIAVRDPRAGWVDPERCNAAHLKVAARGGAELRFEEAVISWSATDAGVEVTTGRDRYTADRLVLSVGARLKELGSELMLPLEVERQAVFWLDPGGNLDRYHRSVFPIYAYEYKPGNICYGFPLLPRGVKASVMHSGEKPKSADEVNRAVGEGEVNALRSALAPVLPELSRARVRESDVCLFTNTPDHDFIIDFHPKHPNVLISSACSGHGFKFASAVGDIQADLVMGVKPGLDLEPFRLSRFVPP
jgi:sarcosine oxidase